MSSAIFTGRPSSEGKDPPLKINAGLREEEVGRILNLKKHLDYSEVLIKYTGKYLSLGWQVVAVTFHGQANLGLDFQQPESQWSRRMVELGLEGVQVNLGVRTGTASRLLVLEVHRQSSLFPFHQPGNWGSRCVAEVGREREQHYYAIPPGWQPPPSHFLSAFQVMVFGEGGLVLAPPSLEPQAQANLRWLKPPWECPPDPPGPLLRKFLQTTAPPASPSQPQQPALPSWEELYPHIADCPRLLQTLLAPASGTDYYHRLLDAALEYGIKDDRLLVGLLWHAPQGNLRNQPEGLAVLQEMVKSRLSQEDPRWWWEPGEAEDEGNNQGSGGEREKDFLSGEAHSSLPRWDPESASPLNSGMTFTDTPPNPTGHILKDTPAQMRQWFSELRQTWQEVLEFSQENLLVERRRYEAMIYELGKLGAWRDIGRQKHRENLLLREKLESQWRRELNYLRRLLKNNR